ncbi:MAG TPA: hypothetical protein VII18_09980 [Mycobacterium sp.]|nr:hypothetical protein [Mycobacterium sp.]
MPTVAEVPALACTSAGDLRGTVEGGVAVWRDAARRLAWNAPRVSD